MWTELLTLFTLLVSIRGYTPCTDCTHSLTCSSRRTRSDGSVEMNLSSDTWYPISWACCSRSDCDSGICDLVECDGMTYGNTCNNLTTFKVVVPEGATSATVPSKSFLSNSQVNIQHRNFAGNKDCAHDGDCCNDNYDSYCRWGVPTVCEVVVPVSSCPNKDECSCDEYCDSLDTSCAEYHRCVRGNKPAGTLCRKSTGDCQDDAFCDGTSAICPPNTFKNGTVCRYPMGDCDKKAFCNGTSATCPPNPFKNGTVCRYPMGDCDKKAFCNGTSATCPPNPFKNGTLCRAAAGDCDEKAFCNGTSATCPPNPFKNGTVCRYPMGDCDQNAVCNGTSATCPPNPFKNGTLCREAHGECDLPDYCSGLSAGCPNAIKNADTICRPANPNDPCDAVDKCDGHSPDCPNLRKFGYTYKCGQDIYVCNVEGITQTNGRAWRWGGCTIGAGRNFINLGSDCADQSINRSCPRGHEVSNIAIGHCGTGEIWYCDRKYEASQVQFPFDPMSE